MGTIFRPADIYIKISARGRRHKPLNPAVRLVSNTTWNQEQIFSPEKTAGTWNGRGGSSQIKKPLAMSGFLWSPPLKLWRPKEDIRELVDWRDLNEDDLMAS